MSDPARQSRLVRHRPLPFLAEGFYVALADKNRTSICLSVVHIEALIAISAAMMDLPRLKIVSEVLIALSVMADAGQ